MEKVNFWAGSVLPAPSRVSRPCQMLTLKTVFHIRRISARTRVSERRNINIPKKVDGRADIKISVSEFEFCSLLLPRHFYSPAVMFDLHFICFMWKLSHSLLPFFSYSIIFISRHGNAGSCNRRDRRHVWQCLAKRSVTYRNFPSLENVTFYYLVVDTVF